MAKLNEELKASLEFYVDYTIVDDDGRKFIKVYAEHGDIYRQYVFHCPNDLDPFAPSEEINSLVEQAKYILTWSIDDAIKKQQHETK